jgi:hypothetical protein
VNQFNQSASPGPRVSVIIPALNEARNLPHVLAQLPSELHEVILVDGRSSDDTVAVARRSYPDVRIVTQTRRGKGNALACGFAVATGDIVVMLDADGSADPKEIGAFVRALVEGADFAKGTRFAAGGSSHDITRFRRWGNRWLNRLVNLLFGVKYTDLCYGYNAFWTHLLPVLDLPPIQVENAGRLDMLWGDGFEIETLINIRMAKAGVQIAEVGSIELVRLHGESKLNAIHDGLRILCTAVHERRLRHNGSTASDHALAVGDPRRHAPAAVELPWPDGDETIGMDEETSPAELAAGDRGLRPMTGGGSATI